MPRSDFTFHHQFRVRWSETDAQGVVFNARYLDYADVAITEYWRATGWRKLYPDEPFEFHVRKATVLFEAPIKPDEMIEVMARTIKTGNSSMTQLVEIHGASEGGDDDLRATIEIVSVHVDLETHRPMPLPSWTAKLFADFDAGKGDAE
ncbi:MAG: thioesterase family protein [Sphingorhabdus sp.]